jgi:hypothetical protein
MAKDWAVGECGECDRVFDLLDENDANEYANGHDCEVA